MAEQDFINCGIGGMLKVTVEDGVIKRMRPLRLTEEDGGHWAIEAKGKTVHRPAQDHDQPVQHRRAHARVLGEPHQVPA